MSSFYPSSVHSLISKPIQFSLFRPLKYSKHGILPGNANPLRYPSYIILCLLDPCFQTHKKSVAKSFLCSYDILCPYVQLLCFHQAIPVLTGILHISSGSFFIFYSDKYQLQYGKCKLCFGAFPSPAILRVLFFPLSYRPTLNCNCASPKKSLSALY